MGHSISVRARHSTHPHSGSGGAKALPGPTLRAHLLRFTLAASLAKITETMQTATDIEQAAIGEILSVVHARTGIDFSAYRERTLHRRILNRMVSVGVDNLERYLELVT